MRRQQLTEAQITALLDPPTDQRELVRHYTLSAADLAAIRRCRGDCNRLGYALMLCYLRYPGRPLKAGERPPRLLLLFIAEQIDALSGVNRGLSRRGAEPTAPCGRTAGPPRVSSLGTRPAADLAGWVLPHAIENDRLVHLAGLVVEECRRRRIVVPSPSALERLCVQARYQARGEVQRRLTDGLSTDPVIPWDRLLASVEEAEALARSEEFDAYQMLGEHYAGIRRWAPTFLDAFVFQGVPAAAALMRAIDMLRDMNGRAVLTLPKSAPISFIRERWARHVFRDGGIDRLLRALRAVELRNRLRAGDVWVVGSRRYRAFEERLISRETLKELERDGTLPIAVDADFGRFIAARRALLNERLAATDVKANGGLLPDVLLDKGVLKITPIEKSTPLEAEALAAHETMIAPQRLCGSHDRLIYMIDLRRKQQSDT